MDDAVCVICEGRMTNITDMERGGDILTAPHHRAAPFKHLFMAALLQSVWEKGSGLCLSSFVCSPGGHEWEVGA